MSRRREWWALAVLGIAAIVVSLVLFAPKPAHASSVRAKTWGVSMFMCDNGISTDWYRTQRAALHEYSLDITSHYSLATRLLHYRNGRNHLVIEWDTPHHCRGAR
jgi:hypothetical protein